MIISFESKKSLRKLKSLHGKTSKVGIEGRYFDIIKVILSKTIVNSVLSGEELKIFPLKS
jgi:hypothetical protein